jgi:hypothetical protein
VDAVDEDGDVERTGDLPQDLPHHADRLAAVAGARREVEDRVGVEEDPGDGIVVRSSPEAGHRGAIEDVADPPRRVSQQLGAERPPFALEERHQLPIGGRAGQAERARLDGLRPPRRRRHGLEDHAGGARRRDRGQKPPRDRPGSPEHRPASRGPD